jgi:conjugative relaxase-like TrwC/TraI family protein
LTRNQFQNLVNGFTPDGKFPLAKNAGSPERQAFWDLTLSVPKDVSVLWMAASPKIREKIDAAILESVKSSLSFAEDRYGLSRRGAGGREWVPAALTFALLKHISSRAGEPDGRQITQADCDLLKKKIINKLFHIDG